MGHDRAYSDWEERLRKVAAGSDWASDALEPGGAWNAYVRAIAGFMSGMEPEKISATDYLTYDDASTGRNWHLPLGYGTLVAASLPSSTSLRLATPAEQIDLTADGRRRRRHHPRRHRPGRGCNPHGLNRGPGR